MKLKLFIAFLLVTQLSNAQYNACAAQSVVTRAEKVEVKDKATGKVVVHEVQVPINTENATDNLKGNEYDLAIDGAFEGQTILVFNLCGNDYSGAKEALKQKGFSVVNLNHIPSVDELKTLLAKSCQMWLISMNTNTLTPEHVEVMKNYFYSGRGVYIWGDNDPLNTEANTLAMALLGVHLSGDYQGTQNVQFKEENNLGGMKKDHLITTGLEFVYEGITISHINDPNQLMTPLIWSSDGQVVTGIYEEQGLRLIVDGGFTRLANSLWSTTGTGRNVKNAAAWLANYERFGDDVLSETLKTEIIK